MSKKPDPMIVPLQSRAFEHGIKIGTLCSHANVHKATWSRWAAGGVPDLAKFRAMETALEELIAEGAS